MGVLYGVHSVDSHVCAYAVWCARFGDPMCRGWVSGDPFELGELFQSVSWFLSTGGPLLV